MELSSSSTRSKHRRIAENDKEDEPVPLLKPRRSPGQNLRFIGNEIS
jgi:hypothetical protein